MRIFRHPLSSNVTPYYNRLVAHVSSNNTPDRSEVSEIKRLPELGVGESEVEFALWSDLSKREKEVLEWICEGKRDREIAMILGISYRTVTVHVRAILRKLEVENRTCAAMLGARVDRRDNGGDIMNMYIYVFLMISQILVREEFHQILQ